MRLFFTDNPSGDKDFYPKMFPSLRVQQEKFDALCDGDAIAENTSDLPLYMSDRFKKVTLLTTKAEMNKHVMAMLETIKDKRIGLDAEWNKKVNAIGMQTGRSKLHTIQIAYRNTDNDMIGVVFQVENIDRLPERLETLLCRDDIDIFGVNVSTDLKYIGCDFHVVGFKNAEQKSRKNVHNLGMFARVRDVVQDAGEGLDVICQDNINIGLG